MVLPSEGAHLWEWFWTVSRRRRTGPEAITYSDLDAWRRLTRTPVLPEEIEILMRMDDAFLTEVREELAAAQQSKPESRKT